MSWLLGGLALGLVSSVHCAAMCGPLMVLVRHMAPRRAGARGQTRAASQAWWLYQGGRIGAYAGLGALAGWLGAGLAASGFGRGLSVVAGFVLLAMALAPLSRLSPGGWVGDAGRVIGRGLRAVQTRAAAHPVTAPIAGGVLNALLPCGMLYAALTAAAGLGRLPLAAGFMVAFGLGTSPLLAAVWLSARGRPTAARSRARYLVPIVLTAMALVLIVRGVSAPGPVQASGMHGHVH